MYTFNAKTISYAGCLDLSPVISAHFTHEMCAAASQCHHLANELKTPARSLVG